MTDCLRSSHSKFQLLAEVQDRIDWDNFVEGWISTLWLEVMEHDNQRSVENANAIWNGIHDKQFYLAEQAPICQGGLRGEFNYLTKTPAAKEVLDGTYEYPTN